MADTSSRSSNRQFNLFSLVWRFAGALLLVLATYNPSGISYFHWLRNATTDGGLGPEHFLVGVALTVPLLVLAMGPMLGLPVEAWIGTRAARWAELVLATPVVLWSGWPFLVRGWTSFRLPSTFQASTSSLSRASSRDSTSSRRFGSASSRPR